MAINREPVFKEVNMVAPDNRVEAGGRVRCIDLDVNDAGASQKSKSDLIKLGFTMDDVILETRDRAALMRGWGEKLQAIYGYDSGDLPLYQATVAFFVNEIKRGNRDESISIDVNSFDEFKLN